MLNEWRDRFEQDDFKMYTVQLPEIGTAAKVAGDSPVAELREVQRVIAQNDPLVEMAVIIDSDQQGNIHPKNKQLPGERLAAIALAKDYGLNVEYSGPVFQGLEIDGVVARLSFSQLGGGLISGKRTAPTSLEIEPGSLQLNNFTVAGSDRVFHPATAEIEGNGVVVKCDAVKKPVAVRYAWADNPENSNFYNQAGFPASPFRTDDWPLSSANELEGKVVIIR
jgi:sialate O-acetylesterase